MLDEAPPPQERYGTATPSFLSEWALTAEQQREKEPAGAGR